MKYEKLFPAKPVLIVEDSKHVLDSFDLTLQSNGVTNVEGCRYSQYLLPLLETGKFSLILLDLNMPLISGEKLLPQIVHDYPDTPVIVVTGVKETKTKDKCLRQGAVAYLEKPVETKILMTAIQTVLS